MALNIYLDTDFVIITQTESVTVHSSSPAIKTDGYNKSVRKNYFAFLIRSKFGMIYCIPLTTVSTAIIHIVTFVMSAIVA